MRPVPQISAAQAARKVRSGARLMVGGFGMTGNPVNLLLALATSDARQLTYIGNNAGEPGLGGGALLRGGQIHQVIGSFFSSNPETVQAVQAGRIEAQLIPQGSLAEAIRAGGAGLAGVLTRTGLGTVLSEGAQTMDIDGIQYLFVPSIRADVAFIRAWKADTAGNLAYRLTEQNFNKAMATAADLVIAEVESIVPEGELAPEQIHTPGCYVDFLVQAHIGAEQLGSSASVDRKEIAPGKVTIAERAAAELEPGAIVNLGIGIPTLVADFLAPDSNVVVHSENGMLGVGPAPQAGGAMDFPVNASKMPVTALPGTSYFDSAESFAMIRGGHVDVAIMGGLQVDQQANLANWAAPDQPLLGVGGAMDLAQGAKRLIITMLHQQKDGTSKLVRACTLPLTARNVVDMVITEMGVFEFPEGQLTLVELMPSSTIDAVRAATGAEFQVQIEE